MRMCEREKKKRGERAQCRASFRASYSRDERVYYSRKLWSWLWPWMERRRRKRGDTDGQCKEISENRPLDCALIKRVFEARGRGRGWSSRVTIFRHSFIPYGTKIHTAVHSSRADAAGNKTRKNSRKKKEARYRGDEGECRRNERHTSALLPGSFFRNKPSSLSLSLALRFWKEIST